MSRRGNSSSRSPQLHKGGACLNCRYRKVRCDGNKPTCSQCAASDIFHDCEYAGRGVTKTQILEDQIASVQRRIQELENPGPRLAEPTPVLLSDPYTSSTQTLSVPIHTQHTILQTFLSHCCGLGFFLDVSRITQSILSSSLNPIERPIPALHLTILLWGIHLSPSAPIRSYESVCVANVVQTTVEGLASSVSHPHSIIQYIQAEVLIAQYFFRVGKILEGKYHMSGAVSLVLSSGMHKFNPGSNNLVNEGERLNGMWTVFALNNCWTAADGSPSNFAIDLEASRIDAPWPVETAQYTEMPPRTTYTLQKFLAGDRDYGTSELAFYVKASLLFEQAGHLSKQYHPHMPNRYFSQFSTFSDLLEKFIQTLPAVNTMPMMGILVHSLAHAAVLALHNAVIASNPTSRSRMVIAVRDIAQLLNTPAPFVDTILAVVWTKACQFLIREISVGRQDEPRALLDKIMRVMASVAPGCHFAGTQLAQVQNSLLSLN